MAGNDDSRTDKSRILREGLKCAFLKEGIPFIDALRFRQKQKQVMLDIGW